MCHRYDTVALQETWLLPNEVSLPANTNNGSEAFSTSSIDTSKDLLVGRPYGDLTFMWKKRISEYVTIVQYDDPRLLELSLKLHTHQTSQIQPSLINVYINEARLDLTRLVCMQL